MKPLQKIVAAHPLAKKPYNAIKFAGVDHNKTPLYTVARDKKTMGAAEALRVAFEKFGGHCFHCNKWMPPQRLSQQCTRDHVRAKRKGGSNHLHNLVFACGPCNRKKGGDDVGGFRPESGEEYLKALEEHLARCLNYLDNK